MFSPIHQQISLYETGRKMAPSLLPRRPENKDRKIYFWMVEIICDVTKNGTNRLIGS
jgi:hypothetical protein